MPVARNFGGAWVVARRLWRVTSSEWSQPTQSFEERSAQGAPRKRVGKGDIVLLPRDLAPLHDFPGWCRSELYMHLFSLMQRHGRVACHGRPSNAWAGWRFRGALPELTVQLLQRTLEASPCMGYRDVAEISLSHQG